MAVLVAGCGLFGDDLTEPGRSAPEILVVTSPAFQDGAAIPRRFTCRAEGASPPLVWTGVPADAEALAVVVSDPDAPGGTYVHWVVLDLDPSADSIQEAAVPTGARQARNSAGRARYDPPCPPSGTHRYRFTVFALRTASGLPDGTDTDRALDAIDARTVGRGTLVGTVDAT